jgi:hypothetical protein
MKKVIINFKNSIAIITVILLSGIGCVSLEEKPLDFTSPDNFYGTVSQIEASLTGAMGELYSQWGGYSYGWGEFHTDHIYGRDLVFSSNHGTGSWNSHYGAIAILNSVIAALNEDKLGSTVAQEEKDKLMGQAKFLRGFNYFWLVRLYGDIPIITEDTDVIAGEITRDPIANVYDLIVADLQVAEADLPDAWGVGEGGRPSKWAAKTLLAKVYITMATAPLNNNSYFQQARDKARDVMDNGPYDLTPDVRNVFDLGNKFSPEIMFSFNATEDDIATPPQIWLPGSMAFGWGDFALEKDWAEAYPEQPRKDAYMILYDWDSTSYLDWDGTHTPHLRKFVYNSRETMESLNTWANIPLIRFADALLLFAEAESQVNGGPTQDAVDAVNRIIDRANDYVDNPSHPKLTTSMSQAEFDAAVIDERGLELFFEYDRWFDLVRKRILCEKVRPAMQVNCDENDYLWPIPYNDLKLNENLTQNPGYTTPQD